MTDVRETFDLSRMLPTRHQIGDPVMVQGRKGHITGVSIRTNTKLAPKARFAMVFYVVRFEDDNNLREHFGHDVLPG